MSSSAKPPQAVTFTVQYNVRPPPLTNIPPKDSLANSANKSSPQHPSSSSAKAEHKSTVGGGADEDHTTPLRPTLSSGNSGFKRPNPVGQSPALSLTNPTVEAVEPEALTFQHKATQCYSQHHRTMTTDHTTLKLQKLIFPKPSIHYQSIAKLRRSIDADSVQSASGGFQNHCLCVSSVFTKGQGSDSQQLPIASKSDKDLFSGVATTSDLKYRMLYFGHQGPLISVSGSGGASSSQSPTTNNHNSGGGTSSSSSKGGFVAGGGAAPVAQLTEPKASLISYSLGALERLQNPQTRERDQPTLLIHPLDSATNDKPLQRLTFNVKCTAHTMGLVFDPTEVSNYALKHSSGSSSASSSMLATPKKQKQSGCNSPPGLPQDCDDPSQHVKCELYLILGFATGDVVVYSCPREAVICRLNSSHKDVSSQQLWKCGVSCIEIIHNQVPPIDSMEVGRGSAVFDGDAPNSTMLSSIIGNHNSPANGSATASPTKQSPASNNGSPQQRQNEGLVNNSILALVGFDTGMIVLTHISKEGAFFIRRFENFGFAEGGRPMAIALAPLNGENDGFEAAVNLEDANAMEDAVEEEKRQRIAAAAAMMGADASGAGNSTGSLGVNSSFEEQLQQEPCSPLNATKVVGTPRTKEMSRRFAQWVSEESGPSICAIATSEGKVYIVSIPDMTTLDTYETFSPDRGTFGGVTALCWSKNWRTRTLFVATEDDSIHVLRFHAELEGAPGTTSIPQNYQSSRSSRRSSTSTGPSGTSPNPLASRAAATSPNPLNLSPSEEDTKKKQFRNMSYHLEFFGQLRHHSANVVGLAHFPSPSRMEDSLLIAASLDNSVTMWHAEEYLPQLPPRGTVLGGGGGPHFVRKGGTPMGAPMGEDEKISIIVKPSAITGRNKSAGEASTGDLEGGAPNSPSLSTHSAPPTFNAARRPSGDLTTNRASLLNLSLSNSITNHPTFTHNSMMLPISQHFMKHHPQRDVAVESERSISLSRPHGQDVVVQVVALDGHFVTACTGGRLKFWQVKPPVITEDLDDLILSQGGSA